MREEEGKERVERRSRRKGGKKRRRWEEDEGIEPAAVFFLFGG